MILWKIVILTWLVIYANCETTDANNVTSETDGTESELSSIPSSTPSSTLSSTPSSTSSSTPSSTLLTTAGKTDPPSTSTTTAVTTTETTTESKSTSPGDIDTDGDTILTPDPSATSDDSDIISTDVPTIYGDDETTTTTTELPTTEGKNQTACSSTPCINGGNCTDNSTNPNLFECTCPSGYVGLRCEVADNCKENENGTVCKNGACDYSADGLFRSCKCFAGEFWNDEDKECRGPDPPCFPNPCQNDGTCLIEGGKGICKCTTDYEGDNCTVHNTCGDCGKGTCMLDSSLTKKYCKCNTGLYWNEEKKRCEVQSLPCAPNPCENGGTCIRLNDEQFNCTCGDGFSGETCEVINKCSEDEDCGRGTCMLSEDETIRMCQCENGFYLEEQSLMCQEIVKPCQPNPCSHGGICIPSSETTFTCVCPEGYNGRTCRIRDLCVMDGGDAFCSNATCNSVHDLEVYFCSCPKNQYFDYSQRKCLDLDLCSLKRCASTETCVQGKCECKPNYYKNNDTGLCEPNFCSSNPCPAPGMICDEGSESSNYQCSCEDGQAFNGTHCNEVSCIFPQLNACEQICAATNASYVCGCVQGFELNEDNHTCTYSGNETCSNKTCDKGSCLVINGMETCICPIGYIEDNGKCVAIDICAGGQLTDGICPDDGCETVPGKGFKCKCEGKYAFSKDKTTCTVRNVCDENETGGKTCSSRNALCVRDWSTSSGFRCKCSEGQIETAGGICRDICSIATNQKNCSSKAATCDVNAEGNMICRCPPYLKANPTDGYCNKPADHSYLVTLPVDQEIYQLENRQKRSLEKTMDLRRILRDVSAMAREMFYGFRDANIVKCKPESGYNLCKIELQFLKVQEADLKRLKINDVCVTVDNSNRCILPPSLVLAKDRFSKDVAIHPTDPCEGDIKEELCGSETTCTSHPQTSKHFNCSCNSGFLERRRIYPFNSTKSYIETCRDIDECTENDPCPVNSECVNTIGSFLCSCKPGFRRVEDPSDSKGERCVDVCDPNPCTHGQCSPRGDHEFDCTCDAGYRGTFCNLKDQNYKEMRTNTVIVGVVLGGVLLIAIILFIACYSRLRKKKSLEESGQIFYSSAEMTERRRVEAGAVNNAFRRE